MSGTIILLNAPKFAGKDTIADILVEKYGYRKYQFKERLFEIASALSGVPKGDFKKLYEDRSFKEEPNATCFGMSTRELFIDISENYCKPRFGRDYFGVVAARALDAEYIANGGNYVFSDSGFPEEALALGKHFGNKNIKIVRFTRPGSDSFAGDSRSFIDLNEFGVHTTPIYQNNRTPEEFANLVHSYSVEKDYD